MSPEENKTATRLVKNSAWLFGAEASSKIIGLATQIIAARYLGDKGYGSYSLAFALSGIFTVFLELFRAHQIQQFLPLYQLEDQLVLQYGVKIQIF